MKNRFLSFVFFFLLCFNLFADTITSVTYFADTRFTGRGNKNVCIVGTELNFVGDSAILTSLKFNLNGTTNIGDIEKVSFYLSTDSVFPERTLDMSGFSMIASFEPENVDSTFSVPISGKLIEGKNYLFMTCDIDDNAGEGNIVKGAITSIESSNWTRDLSFSSVNVGRVILLARKLIYEPGEYGSGYYRIPAIVTAKDGSLVIATDKRKFSQSDLPQDIDIVINRSQDGGKTWSSPNTIALGTGAGQGFGDAALCRSLDTAGLICVFVGGDGLWESVVTSGKKIRSYMSRSVDNGVTWTAPIEITDFIFGSNCSNSQRKNWKASFFGSGSGLLTSSGRIMFAVAVRETTAYSLNNYVVYSDDNGQTWNVSERASVGGDEAKLVELGNDTILMSIRHAGARWYNISTDGGLTWNSSVFSWSELNGNACNADIIRYTSVNHGYEKNRLLHSLPFNSERKNVSLFISYDEGSSWSLLKSVCPYGSAYSSLSILPDGTVGVYIEENLNTDNYSMYFMNFSLKWLSDGNDEYLNPTSIEQSNSLKDNYKVYFNDIEDAIVVSGDNIKLVSVFDSIGKCVSDNKFNDANFAKIDVSMLVSGVYFVKIISANGLKYTKSIVKSK